MTLSCSRCPVCEASVAVGVRRCPHCLRWLRWSTGKHEAGSWLTLIALGLACSLVLALLGLMAGGAERTLVSVQIALFGALTGVLGIDGWLSIRAGVDRTKARVAHGLEARVTGWIKLAFGLFGVLLCLYALAVLPALI